MVARNLTLPPEMVLAYKRYKEDTETVAGWLADESRKAGFKPNTDTASLNKGPKLKGRARKLARDAAKQDPPPSKKYEYTVTTREFIEMAKHIVKVRPPVTLSRSIQAAWQRAIKMRRQCGDWFRSHSREDVSANEKHSHFISILEEALTVLKPCCEPRIERKAPTPTIPSDQPIGYSVKEINNMFAHLKVEETTWEDGPDDTPCPSADVQRTKAAGPQAHIEFDEQEAEGEFYFAIWSFMQDVLALRIHVATNWHLYSLGKIDMIQAASVTNFAVDLVRRAEADFEANLRRPSKYPAMQYPTGALPSLICKLHVPAVPDYPVQHNDILVQKMIVCGCSTCDFLLYIPWVMTKQYVDMLQREPPTFPTPQNKSTVRVPPMPPMRRFKSWNASPEGLVFRRAVGELREILPNSSLLSLMMRNQGFLEDEILHAARHILENHTVTIWVSLAFQIQLDIQHLNDLHPIKALQDLRLSFQTTKRRCRDHQKWSKSLDFEVWPKYREEHVGWVAEQFGSWIEGSREGKADPEEVLRRHDAGQSWSEAQINSKRVPLLEYFPVTCGTMKVEIQLEFHVLGLILVNMTGHVPMLCHLYNTLRILDPDTQVWPDMELFIRNQGPAKIFVADRPTTLEDAQKRLRLALGMSVASLARDSRSVQFSRARQLEHSPIVQNLFGRWLGRETRKVDEAAYELQELLFNKEYQRRLKQDMHMATALETDPLLAKLVPVQSKMVQILSTLSRALTAEMPAIAFDYFAFERQCFSMFLEINADISTNFTISDSQGSKKRKAINCPFVSTLFMLDHAVKAEGISKMVDSIDRTMHRAAAQTMAKQIQAMMVCMKDERSQELMEKALKMSRAGRMREFLKDYVDTTHHAAARNLFVPVQSAVVKLLKSDKEDRRIKKLRKVTGKTTYGIFLFRQASLEKLYGPGKNEQWKTIGVAEATIEQAMQANADNAVHFVNAARFLHQQKDMCEEKEDYDVANELESAGTSFPRLDSDAESLDEDDLGREPMSSEEISVLQRFGEVLSPFIQKVLGEMDPTVQGWIGSGDSDRMREFVNTVFRRVVDTVRASAEGDSVDHRDTSRVEAIRESTDEGEKEIKEKVKQSVEEEWEKFEGIYGRTGRYSID